MYSVSFFTHRLFWELLQYLMYKRPPYFMISYLLLNLTFKTLCPKQSQSMKIILSPNSLAKIPTKIFKYIKSLSKNSTLPPTMLLDSTPATSDSEKAELFNRYFHSGLTNTTYVLPPISDLPTPATSNTLSNIVISESDILEELTSLDPTKASGLDNIGPNLLKDCSLALTTTLNHLFSMCIQQCSIPSEWKIHLISPIHKSVDKSSIKNSHPIFVT